MNREFYTEDDLEEMGVRSKKSLQKDRLYSRGIPYVKIMGSVRYRRADLEAYIRRNTKRPAESIEVEVSA